MPRDCRYRGAMQSREIPEDVVDDQRGVRHIDNVVFVCRAAGIVVHHVSHRHLATRVAPLERSALYCWVKSSLNVILDEELVGLARHPETLAIEVAMEVVDRLPTDDPAIAGGDLGDESVVIDLISVAEQTVLLARH